MRFRLSHSILKKLFIKPFALYLFYSPFAHAKRFSLSEMLQLQDVSTREFITSEWINSDKFSPSHKFSIVFGRVKKEKPLMALSLTQLKNAEISFNAQGIKIHSKKADDFAYGSSPFNDANLDMLEKSSFFHEEAAAPKDEFFTDLNKAQEDVQISVQDEFGTVTSIPQSPAASFDQLLSAEDMQQLKASDEEKRVLHLDSKLLLASQGAQEISSAFSFNKIGQKLHVSFGEAALKDQLGIFIKNESILSWDADAQAFLAKEKGETEVFFTINKKMLIVQVGVEQPVQTNHGKEQTLVSVLDSQANDSLVSKNQSFVYADFDEQLADAETGAKQETTFEVMDRPEDALLNIETVQKKIEKQEQKQELIQNQVYRNRKSIASVPVVIQVLEDSSYNSEARILPAGSVKLKLVGTQIEMQTAPSGLTQSFEVPAGSRILVMIDDPLGRYQSGSLEFDAPLKKDASGAFVKKVYLMNRSTHQTFSQMALGLQDDEWDQDVSEEGSFCVSIKKPTSVNEWNELSAQVDDEGARVLFFNDFGFVETEQQHVGPSGRVCVFGAKDGPLAFQVLDVNKNQILAQVPISVFSERHAYYELDLNQRLSLATTPLVSTSFEDQILDQLSQNHYKATDWADLYPISSFGSGGFSPFLPNSQREGYGLLGEQLLSFEGRSFYMVQAPEFESALYAVSTQASDGKDHGTILLPSGFMNRAAAEAGYAWHNETFNGSIFIEHGRMLEETKSMGGIQIEVFDSKGDKMPSSMVFADGGSAVSKALFANLAPGTYSVVVTTEKGYWLASSTAIVYSQVVSHIQTGSVVKSFYPEPSI